MRMILFAMLLCGALSSQDFAKERIETPLRQVARSPKPEKYDLSRTGITWHEGIDAVLDKGRPILLFQLLGQFDDVYC